MSEIVQPLRFCDVLCISRSTCTYTYTAELMYAQLTRCFSAVAELLVIIGLMQIQLSWDETRSCGVAESKCVSSRDGLCAALRPSGVIKLNKTQEMGM